MKYDILAIEKRLLQIGFDVVKMENVSRSDYLPILQQSVERCPNDAVHIVYFSGHGGHYNGNNYLYPSNFATLYDATNNIDSSSINIESIIPIFKNKGRLILILDACRSDFGLSKGYFSEMISSENTYIAYGTMFQNTSTGTNGLSWFTEAICDEILFPNIDVDALFTQIRQNIFAKHSTQLPISVNGLLENVVLHTELNYCETDKMVYDFVERYGDVYKNRFCQGSIFYEGGKCLWNPNYKCYLYTKKIASFLTAFFLVRVANHGNYADLTMCEWQIIIIH